MYIHVGPLIPNRRHTRTPERLGLTRIRIDTAKQMGFYELVGGEMNLVKSVSEKRNNPPLSPEAFAKGFHDAVRAPIPWT